MCDMYRMLKHPIALRWAFALGKRIKDGIVPPLSRDSAERRARTGRNPFVKAGKLVTQVKSELPIPVVSPEEFHPPSGG